MWPGRGWTGRRCWPGPGGGGGTCRPTPSRGSRTRRRPARGGVRVAGGGGDGAGVLAGAGGRRVDLPTYPFQRQRYWPRPAVGGRDVASAGLAAAGHPLLGAAVELAGSDAVVFTGRLSVQVQPWLADHVVGGMVLFPGTGFVELAVRAGDRVGCGTVAELTLAVPLVLPEHGAGVVQGSGGGGDEGGGRGGGCAWAGRWGGPGQGGGGGRSGGGGGEGGGAGRVGVHARREGGQDL